MEINHARVCGSATWQSDWWLVSIRCRAVPGKDRQEKAEAIIRKELKRRKFTEEGWAKRAKGEPTQVMPAAQLR